MGKVEANFKRLETVRSLAAWHPLIACNDSLLSFPVVIHQGTTPAGGCGSSRNDLRRRRPEATTAVAPPFRGAKRHEKDLPSGRRGVVLELSDSSLYSLEILR
jgi:hypothetical protein